MKCEIIVKYLKIKVKERQVRQVDSDDSHSVPQDEEIFFRATRSLNVNGDLSDVSVKTCG